MSLELKKRILTSICLLTLLSLMFFYTYILIIFVILIAIILWVEFYAIISKIFLKNNFKNKICKFFFKAISLIYLSFLAFLILTTKLEDSEIEIIIFYSILISIMSDIGGLVIGKTFKGKKLTSISPNKTISGSIGSFVFSLFLMPIFMNFYSEYDYLFLFIATIAISLTSQIGDLFISFLKRKANVKDTSDILPGHGGALDRLDGIIFAIPIGYLIFNYF